MVLPEWQNLPKTEFFLCSKKWNARYYRSKIVMFIFLEHFFFALVIFVDYMQEKVFQENKHLDFWPITSCVPFYTAKEKTSIFGGFCHSDSTVGAG